MTSVIELFNLSHQQLQAAACCCARVQHVSCLVQRVTPTLSLQSSSFVIQHALHTAVLLQNVSQTLLDYAP